MLNPANTAIRQLLNDLLGKLEDAFNSDFISICGPISVGLENMFLHIVEELAADANKRETLLVMITTNGGSVQVVERMVHIFRKHYAEVNFIVPDYAYSAGTILCMSGDNIYMDYFSALGPIDPQVMNKEGKFVPALGYLDKINDLLERARAGTISQAELLILKDLDLAEIREYEQARELTVDLLKKWLANYKFKNWNIHASTGVPVTPEDKENRAGRIASELNDYAKWKSHARPLNIDTLRSLKLKIEDFGEDKAKSRYVREYYSTMMDFKNQLRLLSYVHSRRFQ
jgi:hypothetical protein